MMKNKNFVWIIFFGVILLLSACTPKNQESELEEGTQPDKVLNVMTHDSFSVSDDLITQFEAENNVKINFLLSGDTGAAPKRAILPNESPQPDIFFAGDNTII